jgi:flavorubredoxin
LCRLEIGTTYNSYLIFGDDKTALVDASHEKFHSLYMDTLKKQLKKAGRDTIDYVIVSHTEPDHSGLIQYLVDDYPDVIVSGSKVHHLFSPLLPRDSSPRSTISRAHPHGVVFFFCKAMQAPPD